MTFRHEPIRQYRNVKPLTGKAPTDEQELLQKLLSTAGQERQAGIKSRLLNWKKRKNEKRTWIAGLRSCMTIGLMNASQNTTSRCCRRSIRRNSGDRREDQSASGIVGKRAPECRGCGKVDQSCQTVRISYRTDRWTAEYPDWKNPDPWAGEKLTGPQRSGNRDFYRFVGKLDEDHIFIAK